MVRTWEIRGLFGNEYALEKAVEELKKENEGFDLVVLDRRNLSVRLNKRNEKLESIIRRTFEIQHGFVESEAPLGEYDEKKEAIKQKKLKEFEEKKKRAQQQQKRQKGSE
jgi:hypothetical protein